MTALKITSLGELLDQEIKPRKLMISPWFKERQACMLYAETGIGKSMFSMCLALLAAGGGEYLGWRSNGRHKVLIVDGEMDIEDLKQRSEQMMSTIPGLDIEKARANLVFLARHGQSSDVRFPDLNLFEGRLEILKFIRELGIELVILDNFSTLAEVTNENEAHSFNGVLELLKTLKQDDCASILVHHSRKDANSYRGTSKIGVIFDSIIKLSKNTNPPIDSSIAFDLSWEKVRANKDQSMRTITVGLGSEKGENQAWYSVVSEEDELNRIINELCSLKHPSDKSIAKKMGISPSNLSQKKRHIFARGLMTETKWRELLGHSKSNALEDS